MTTPTIIAEYEDQWGDEVLVLKDEPATYTVVVGGVVRHPNTDADGAIRALATYHSAACYTLAKSR